MSATHTETVRLRQRQDYQFEVDFGHVSHSGPALATDLPPPLGQAMGPSPEQLLCAAVANCLSASLLFSLRKFKQQPEPIGAVVECDTGRNAEGRQRVLQIRAQLTLGVAAEQLEHIERVLGSFEAFCTVTQSVAAGIPVQLQVFDATGKQLK